MAIKYSIQQRTQAGIKGGGQRKYYASISTVGEVGIDELVREIEKYSPVRERDIRGVIVALENAIQKSLTNSMIVRLETLGAFYPAISSEGKVNEEDVNEDCIKDININYRPGRQMLQALEDAGCEKNTEKKVKEKVKRNRK